MVNKPHILSSASRRHGGYGCSNNSAHSHAYVGPSAIVVAVDFVVAVVVVMAMVVVTAVLTATPMWAHQL